MASCLARSASTNSRPSLSQPRSRPPSRKSKKYLGNRAPLVFVVGRQHFVGTTFPVPFDHNLQPLGNGVHGRFSSGLSCMTCKRYCRQETGLFFKNCLSYEGCELLLRIGGMTGASLMKNGGALRAQRRRNLEPTRPFPRVKGSRAAAMSHGDAWGRRPVHPPHPRWMVPLAGIEPAFLAELDFEPF